MVFQRPNPLPISIRDNILFSHRLHAKGGGDVSKGKPDEIVEESLRQVLLWDKVKDRLKRKATELSLEEQQKLCIARLLPVNPVVLLMDEPCSALDPKGTEAVEELICAASCPPLAPTHPPLAHTAPRSSRSGARTPAAQQQVL